MFSLSDDAIAQRLSVRTVEKMMVIILPPERGMVSKQRVERVEKAEQTSKGSSATKSRPKPHVQVSILSLYSIQLILLTCAQCLIEIQKWFLYLM